MVIVFGVLTFAGILLMILGAFWPPLRATHNVAGDGAASATEVSLPGSEPLIDPRLPAAYALCFGLGGLIGMYLKMGERDSALLGLLCAVALPMIAVRLEFRRRPG